VSGIDRSLAGEVLHFDLQAELHDMHERQPVLVSGRTGRTLVKDGPLRVTLIVMEPGSEIPEHVASGPITIQALQGTVRILLGGRAWELGEGQLLTAAGGAPHAVETDTGAAFLLTVVQPQALPG
jgi:quercetin dioxygenase-like cupin family protein